MITYAYLCEVLREQKLSKEQPGHRLFRSKHGKEDVLTDNGGVLVVRRRRRQDN
ncbi:MAG: hypothetical protein PHQ43_09385 [Dehalococcoidales bacterium]|nr:hypothetical protein [Dehalococcoidales bacterium]